LRLGPPPWASGETTGYQITDVNGQSAGTARYEITQGDSQTNPAGWSIRREIMAQGVNETIAVELNKGLQPLRSVLTRTQQAQGGREVVEATYNGGQVDMVLTTAQDVTTNQRINIPSDSSNGDVLIQLLRTLPLQKGYATRINVFWPIAGQLETYVVNVADTEQVNVPAGAYDTFKVELTGRGNKTTAWLNQAAPHQVVKYIDGRNSGTFELTDFTPGDS
nr:DUF3108 domain-containing protein [Caldilineaceae bacterium]